ncbi:2146_t:CDS:2, partial [Paraglomus occultum]
MAKQMSSKFNYEHERKEAFIDIMRTYLQNYSFSGNEISGFQSDGHIVLTIKGEETILSILEVKPEFGKGHGCAYIQASAYYAKYVLKAQDKCWEILKKTCCPVFILYVAGPFLGFAANFPYPCEFNHLEQPGNKVKFTYLERLFENKLIYLATLSDAKEHYQIIVKFTKIYGKNAHCVAAKCGHAPKVLGYDKIGGDWKMKMMAEIQDKEAVKDKVTKAVRTLHESGYVHGDLQDCNIMVKTNMKEIKILDFDWAGPVGEARYPWFMNPNIPWHPDVYPNELIQENHDRYFVKKTC